MPKMEKHEKFLRSQGLGHFIDDMPDFLKDCDYDDKKPELCQLCPMKVECDKYFQPLAKALERYSEIGEV